MDFHVRKRWPILGTALVLVAACFLLAKCFHRSEDFAYHEVLARANPSQTLDHDQTYCAKQLRKGVQKNIWYNKGNRRLEFFLTSVDAEMVFEKQGDRQEIVEHMTDVQCYFQEELYYQLPDGRKVVQQNDGGFYLQGKKWSDDELGALKPMQTVRYIEADVAQYHYSTETLVANHIKMSLYTAQGHQLLPLQKRTETVMDGNAEWVEVSLVNKELQFKSKKFQGRML